MLAKRPIQYTPVLCAAILVALGSLPSAATAQEPGGQAAGSPATELNWVVAHNGNEARYRVREQLLGFDFPNDAVGVTSAVTGTIVLDDQGRIVPERSRIVVGLVDLISDSDRRDNFIRRRTLEAEAHPNAVFVPRDVLGLDALPPAGEVSFEVEGDLTVRDVTRPVVWDVTARLEGDAVVGTATTRFPFGHFDLEIPRVRSVLSVDDDIRLEYDFRFESARQRSAP